MSGDESGCICACYDGRGYSTCGFECRVHPPTGKCPFNNRKCIFCSMKDGEED